MAKPPGLALVIGPKSPADGPAGDAPDSGVEARLAKMEDLLHKIAEAVGCGPESESPAEDATPGEESDMGGDSGFGRPPKSAKRHSVMPFGS